MRSLRYIRLQMDFIESVGKELKFHEHKKNEPSHYCHTCDVSKILKALLLSWYNMLKSMKVSDTWKVLGRYLEVFKTV